MCARGWEAYMEKWPGSKIHLKVTSFSSNALESQMQLARGFPGDAIFRGSCLGLLGNCKSQDKQEPSDQIFLFFKPGVKFT